MVDEDNIFILSAKHCLVPLKQRLCPYKVTLNNQNITYRRLWSKKCLKQLSKVSDLNKDKFIILAGKKYTEFIKNYLSYYNPVEGLTIGYQLKFFKKKRGIQKW